MADLGAGRDLFPAVRLDAVDPDYHRVPVEAILKCDVDQHDATGCRKPVHSSLVPIVTEYKAGESPATDQLRHLTVQPTGGVSATGGVSPASAASMASRR